MELTLIAGGILRTIVNNWMRLYVVIGEMYVNSRDNHLEHIKTLPFSEIMTLTPAVMAKSSAIIAEHFDYLKMQAQSIGRFDLREKTLAMLENPAPTFMEKLVGQAERQQRLEQLTAAGYYQRHYYGSRVIPLFPSGANDADNLQSFDSAPGSGYFRHHAYPGGLVIHTSVNLQSALSMKSVYEHSYGFSVDADVLIAAQILHDCQKPWVLQWLANGRIFPQASLARTGSHHVFGLAESITRGFPAEVVIAQACAHNHLAAKDTEGDIVGWIRAACILTESDPVHLGYLALDGQTLPKPRSLENCITHLGDHNWVVSLPASQWMNPLLERIAQEEYGLTVNDLNDRPYYQLRNYLYSQITTLVFYQLYATKGEKAVRNLVRQLVSPT